HLIIDAALAAKLEERSPLHSQQFVRDRPVLPVMRRRRSCSIVGRAKDGVQLIAVVLPEVVIDARVFGTIVLASLLEMLERRLDGDPVRIALFAIGTRGARESQGP